MLPSGIWLISHFRKLGLVALPECDKTQMWLGSSLWFEKQVMTQWQLTVTTHSIFLLPLLFVLGTFKKIDYSDIKHWRTVLSLGQSATFFYSAAVSFPPYPQLLFHSLILAYIVVNYYFFPKKCSCTNISTLLSQKAHISTSGKISIKNCAQESSLFIAWHIVLNWLSAS